MTSVTPALQDVLSSNSNIEQFTEALRCVLSEDSITRLVFPGKELTVGATVPCEPLMKPLWEEVAFSISTPGGKWRTNLAVLGEKLLKLLASEYAVCNEPTIDTEAGTDIVACLVSEAGLSYALRKVGLSGITEEMHAVVGLMLCRVGWIEVATFVFKCFDNIQKRFGEMNKLLRFFCHRMRTRNIAPRERIELIREALLSRGVIIRVDQPIQHPTTALAAPEPLPQVPGSSASRAAAVGVTFGKATTVAIFHAQKLITTLPCTSEGEYFRIVLREAKHAMLFMTRGKCARSKTSVAASALAGEHFSTFLESLPKADQQGLLKRVMKTTTNVLRLRPAHSEVLRERGLLTAVIDANGWIPLTEVTNLLRHEFAQLNPPQVAPTEDILRAILEEHDYLQRLEVGVCGEPGPFYGLQCARATYAHEIRQKKIYQTIFQTLAVVTADDDGDGDDPVPEFVWINVASSKFVKKVIHSGWTQYDQIDFLVGIDPIYLDLIARYRELPGHLRCDAKCSTSNLLFLEFNLRAAARDPQLCILRRPQRNKLPGHFIIIPEGPRYTVSAPCDTEPSEWASAMKKFPLLFFTGRECTISAATNDNETAGGALGFAPVTSNPAAASDQSVAEEPTQVLNYRDVPGLGGRIDKTVVFTPEEIAAFFPDADPGDEMQCSDEATAIASDERVTVVAAPLVRLDLTSAMEQVRAFVTDDEQVSMKVSLPMWGKAKQPFHERRRSIEEFKKWVLGESLSYCELPSAPHEKATVLMLRKSQPVKLSVLKAVASALGVTFADEGLLKTALTPEALNKTDNYEMLEFIGDAVMDFVVVCEAMWVRSPMIAHTVSRLCCNSVIAALLPPVLDTEIRRMSIFAIEKRRADVFEALVGAVFRDWHSLDQVRHVLNRLFAQLPSLLKRQEEVLGHESLPEAREVVRALTSAAECCPFLPPLRPEDQEAFWRRHPLLLTESLLQRLAKRAAQDGAGGSAARGAHRSSVSWALSESDEDTPPDDRGGDDVDGGGSGSQRRSRVPRHVPVRDTPNSHLAITGFPRVQNKGFATHFTTGPNYAYRRINSPSTVHVFNRIVQQYCSGQVAYVNEVLEDIIHLTFDFDGQDAHYCGALRLVFDWYQSRFRCGASGLVLDCSGWSVVPKQGEYYYKHSCHLHFPQTPVTLAQLPDVTADLSQYVRRQLVDEWMCGCRVFPGMIVATAAQRVDVKESPSEALVPRLWRVLWSSAVWTSRVDALRRRASPCAATDEARRAGVALPCEVVAWEFMDIHALVALSQVDWRHRQSVACHLAALARDVRRLAAILGVADRYVVGEPGGPGVAPPVGYSLVRLVPASLLAVALAKSAPASAPAGGAPACVYLVPDALLTPIHDANDFATSVVEPTTDVLRMSPGVRSSSINGTDYYCNHVTPMLQQSVFNQALWDKVIDTGLASSRKLRMYLCDKFDMKYHQEYRPLTFHAVLTATRLADGAAPQMMEWSAPSRTTAPPGPSTTSGGGSSARVAPPGGHPVGAEMAHMTVLGLSSLGVPQFRDGYGALLCAWTDADLDPLGPASGADGVLDGHGACGPTDLLPGITDLRHSTEVAPSSWSMWIDNLFGYPVTDGHGPLFPSYWVHSTRSRMATFYVGGEPCLAVHRSNSLAEALAPTSAGGMVRLARLMTPHVAVESLKADRYESKTISSYTVYPLFQRLPKKAPTASLTNVSTSMLRPVSGDGGFAQIADAGRRAEPAKPSGHPTTPQIASPHTGTTAASSLAVPPRPSCPRAPHAVGPQPHVPAPPQAAVPPSPRVVLLSGAGVPPLATPQGVYLASLRILAVGPGGEAVYVVSTAEAFVSLAKHGATVCMNSPALTRMGRSFRYVFVADKHVAWTPSMISALSSCCARDGGTIYVLSAESQKQFPAEMWGGTVRVAAP